MHFNFLHKNGKILKNRKPEGRSMHKTRIDVLVKAAFRLRASILRPVSLYALAREISNPPSGGLQRKILEKIRKSRLFKVKKTFKGKKPEYKIRLSLAIYLLLFLIPKRHMSDLILFAHRIVDSSFVGVVINVFWGSLAKLRRFLFKLRSGPVPESSFSPRSIGRNLMIPLRLRGRCEYGFPYSRDQDSLHRHR